MARATQALRRKGEARAFALAAFVLSLLVLLPDLGEAGFWGDGELPLAERARAALGLATGEFLRTPALPEALRVASLTTFGRILGTEAALRLPHALAAAGVVALAAGTGRALWGRPAGAWAGAVALATPLLALSGRTLLGDPVGELALGLSVLAGAVACLPGRAPWLRVGAALFAATALAAAVACRGLAFGAALPLATLALGLPPRVPRRLRVGLGLAAAAAALGAAALAWRQGDGFVPLLAALKDTEALDDPTSRRLAAPLADLGHQIYPWLPLALVGVLLGGRRARLPAAWLLLTLALTLAWSPIYGRVPAPLVIPSALGVAAAARLVVRGPRLSRRAVLLVATLALLTLARDAATSPQPFVTLLVPPISDRFFPIDALDLAGRTARLGKLVLACWLLAGALAGLGRGRPRLRALLASAALFLAPTLAGPVWIHAVLTPAFARLSAKGLLSTFQRAARRGALSPTLLTMRVRSPELDLYLPGGTRPVPNRQRLAEAFAGAEPVAALVRRNELAGLFQLHRQDGWPLYVLDDRHAHLLLVSNVLPTGMEDRDPLPDIVRDHPPQLAHPTLVRFDEYVEVIGWEIQEPVVRGSSRTMQVAFRVLKPLPAGAKLYARLQARRTSRIQPEPVELTGGLYPGNYWRAGDYILHRHTFRVPVLEVLTGPHQVVLGMQRNEKKNLKITVPGGMRGEYGVRIKDRRHSFAVVGHIQVW